MLRWGRTYASAPLFFLALSKPLAQTLDSSTMLAGNGVMKATLEAINQMQTDGVIGKYAIGGAVGATFYLQAAATLDVDIFVTLPTSPGGLLLSLAPIYDYLKASGGKVEDRSEEHTSELQSLRHLV